MLSNSDILFERRGTAGVVTLNRPHALNAVSHGMVRALAQQLAEWETDTAVMRVIVTANGGRAFSAGGDLRALYDLGRAGRYDEALAYFRDEYALNARIKRYRKPYVALIDGIVMGGGRRHLGAWFPSRRRRQVQLRDARGRHRVLSRCRGDLVPAAPAGRARHLLRAHRRAARCRRRAWPPASPPTGFPRRGFPIWSRPCAARSRSMPCSARSRSRPGRGRSWRARPRSTACSRAAGSRTFSPRSMPRRRGPERTTPLSPPPRPP